MTIEQNSELEDIITFYKDIMSKPPQNDTMIKYCYFLENYTKKYYLRGQQEGFLRGSIFTAGFTAGIMSLGALLCYSTYLVLRV